MNRTAALIASSAVISIGIPALSGGVPENREIVPAKQGVAILNSAGNANLSKREMADGIEVVSGGLANIHDIQDGHSCKSGSNIPYGEECIPKMDVEIHSMYNPCHSGDGNPTAIDLAETIGSMPRKNIGNKDEIMSRRGHMAADDGVLEVIGENPCANIHLRGKHANKSGDVLEEDSRIHRANTLESHRIPVHKVGRYLPDDSTAWYRHPRNPFAEDEQLWRIQKGGTLRGTLASWGDASGFSVVWHSPHDYILETDAVIAGTFPEAAGQVIESFSNALPPVAGEFYPQNRVLVIDSASEFDGR
ncbi:MAG: toxin co-regulated pilus biosynthesis Q family protein [Roseovarius sp.]|nr:toxin co-regulated pilus biosynthesis Q family protein [Roseovarius sp.]MCY4293150.1 toxin co-regulated pilus biosynthesis Q family protein [Roseovarius sp.]